MPYEDLVILIPCHSLEDFPTELPDNLAAGLLNSWVVPWHPLLLKSANVLPRWHRADDPPQVATNRLVMLPAKCKDMIPAGWIERARREGATVITDLTDRQEMLDQALKPLGEQPTVDPDLAADFLALGFCYLQVELLTRHMRNFSNLDEVHLHREAVGAANAACEGDAATARTRLKTCFEVLTEARERFYPVDCYLIDLCLLLPRLADEHLTRTLQTLKPLNLILCAEDVEEIARDKPAEFARVKEAWERGSVDVVGGTLREAPLPLLPIESVLWQFQAGRDRFQKLFGRKPTVWGSRRFAIYPQLPQILHRYGYIAAMHVALDDGFYPDMEYSKVRWEGTNGTIIDAISRIPLAAEGANSFLRFPVRMAESMDNDHVAAVLFARWPEVKAPWFDDLRRMQNYSPVLGRFVTLDDYFQHTDSGSKLSGYDVNEYLTPFLVQAVAREEAEPIGRFTNHFLRRQKYDTATWFQGLRAALIGRPVTANAALEQTIEAAGPDGTPEAVQAADAQLQQFAADTSRELAELVVHGAGAEAGMVVLNPLSFARTVSVDLAGLPQAPAIGEAVKFVQWDDTRRYATLELPASGFVWLPAQPGKSAAPKAKPAKGAVTALAEENVLRNDFFEVLLNLQTGGIGQIKNYGRSPNRLSLQLAYRFARERKIGEDVVGDVKSFYSHMQVLSSQVTCAGPALGEIVTTGDILDQANSRKLAGFRMTYRVWRGRPVVEVDIELDVATLPDGDPWSNYYAARFAWNDSAAALTRSVMCGAQGIKEQRFESPHYFEIASDEQRTTILNLGLPFHRKTGDRMLDTLLICPGETRRKFRFVIAIDQSYPMQAALDALVPPTLVPTTQGPPRSGNSGWFFHLSARNVQLTRILGLLDAPPEHVDPWDRQDHETVPAGRGCAVRLIETEGRPVRVQLRCFRTPVSARQRDFQGRTLNELTIEDEAVIVDLTGFEIADVELRFE